MVSGVPQTLNRIVRQQAGRFLTWITQETGSTATNTNSVAVSVSGRQVCKICVQTSNSLDIHIQYKYEGKDVFFTVDG